MAENRSWNWDNVSDAYWSEPAEEVYYLLQRWQKAGHETILDLGCGLGRHAQVWAAHNFKTIALDSSASGLIRLHHAAEEQKLSMGLVRADLTKLPFKAASFDCLLAYHAIYHVDRAGFAAALAELYRVLKPKAEVYVTFLSKRTPTFAAPANRIIDENVRLKSEDDGSLLPHFFCDRDDIRSVLSGFRIIKLRHIEDFYDDKTSWHYFVLAARN